MGTTSTNSLAHTKWMCKYHIVFTPKYQWKAIYSQYKENIGQWVKRDGDNKGAPDGRSCTHVGKHPAQDQRIEFYGIFEREECTDDI